MRKKIETREGRYQYSQRMAIVEPVFGNIYSTLGLNRFSLCTKKKVDIQWKDQHYAMLSEKTFSTNSLGQGFIVRGVDMKGNQEHSGIFDFFISYKQKDSKEFAKYLLESLQNGGAEVWLDQVEMNLGDSILEGIETGIKSSIDAILILSENYFTGWSKQERDNLFSLMVSGKTRIVPIWYKLSLDDIESLSPMLSGVVSAKVENGDKEEALHISSRILERFNPKQRELRLYELFFQAVRKHVKDPDLDIFLAVFRNDTKLLESALERGGNPNITDASLWNRYNKIITEHEDVFPSWRKLFLHLSSAGKIGGE